MISDFYGYYRGLLRKMEDISERVAELNEYSSIRYDFKPSNQSNKHSRVEDVAIQRSTLISKFCDLMDLRHSIDNYLAFNCSSDLYLYVMYKVQEKPLKEIRKKMSVTQKLKEQEEIVLKRLLERLNLSTEGRKPQSNSLA